MKRITTTALYLLLLGVAGSAFPVWAEEARCESFAALERTQGQVRVSEEASPFPQRISSFPYLLCPGDKVQTVSQAQAHISHPGGDLVMAENSLLTVNSIEEVELETGAALFHIAQREGARFVANTPLVVIGVKGTRFLVSANDERNDVALFEGGVEVERQDGQEMAYYRAKDISEMTFDEYRRHQNQAFRDFQAAFNQAFNDYKDQVMAEFEAFKRGIDLEPGRQLTLGSDGEQAEAVDAPVDAAFDTLQQQLGSWLR
ncbi:FecR family protein [Marinospirillum celere]|uniref:FecR family protein n=1 Tax=Marinospirillum celere TaxID=1122252 RepID=A0A1I1JCE0_9GAMM|nr:FecR family protein [Marinospirillum celere]SFC46096.1 FecR family protein [Marinospirillum celere]